MASPKKYKAKVRKVHVRMLWTAVQNTKAENRTHDDWLSAANRELLPFAEVDVRPGGRVKADKMDKPDELVELLLSFEAVCGIKHAVIQSSKVMAFLERRELLEATEGFGSEFAAKVKKLAKLPESDDLDEDAELEGVPAVEESKLTLVKTEEAPRG